MIIKLKEVPENIAAFRATGDITKEDYQLIVQPAVEQHIEKNGKINFLLYLDSGTKNFTTSAWYEDIMLSLRNLGQWHRAAIVIDNSIFTPFTNAFSYIMPGEFKGFTKEFYHDALTWVSED